MSDPTRVLLLTPQTPYPPDQGAPIRNFAFVRYLGSNLRYELSLLTFARPGEDPEKSPARAVLKEYCRNLTLVPHPPARSKPARIAALATSRQPDLTRRLASPLFEAALLSLLRAEKFDVIQCEGLEMAPFLLDQLIKLPQKPRLVLDEHNAEYLMQRRIFENDWQAGWKRRPAALYSLLQARRLARYETASLAAFDRVIAVSEADRQALAKLGPARNPLIVIPNAIDLVEFSPSDGEGLEQPDTLVFTGTMDFRPNIDAVSWFAREVWPLVRAARPQARFLIVGRRPAPEVEVLKELPGIIVTGEVPDARPYIRQSSLYVVPMRMGGGVRYKVLEALAMGKAVVSTTMGADGINLEAGREAVIAPENSQEFSQAILTLLADPARRAALGKQGRTFVESHFDWRNIVPQIDSVLLK
ncbi:MAG TPA: glycosyltransferase [Chloroflexia bacterium]|nr:glycosyltransferase [Chloroflexia bacterium]